jgi:uncharacterized protein YjiS (DUF1127 family)
MHAGVDPGSLGLLTRMARALRAWSRDRTVRRGASFHGFTALSDRALADIGVRRADMHAAMTGMLPVEHIARTHASSPWTAQVHALQRAPSEALAPDDLSAAA